MGKTLVLVRHGKPERGGTGQPDADRSLTPEGQAALAAPDGFPRIFANLSQTERAAAELWVSPALRARQTADEVERALASLDTPDTSSVSNETAASTQPCAPSAAQALPRSKHESLWEQDIDGFLEELAASSAECVIAVGHIPFMNVTLELLTGENPGFTPGSVAAVALPDNFDPARPDRSGHLIWFERGPRA